VADGEDVVRADEDVHLAYLQLVGRRELDGVEDDEQGAAVFLDLRPLVAVARVLGRELVQVELLLHLEHFLVARVLHRHPDEDARLLQVVADLAPVDVRELAAFLVDDAVDEHGGGRCYPG
jgi:hypothetical protein